METAPRRSPILEPGDEARLVRAAQSGDQNAFAEIVRHFQRAVYRVAYALTRNASDADDLAQETFVRAYQAIGRFRAGEPLYPWLARIAVNQAYSLHRHRKRRPETSIEPLVEAGRQWAGEDDPAENAAESERNEMIQAAFAGLSPEHQAVLTLRVVEGLSYDEIAETVGVPVGTVMSRLSRARADLKTRLRARTGEMP
ncbi:MAG: sigma-70 family RNA polymerase sigma factor [Candidatus Eisenbacteria bacterium]|nr:sigma-70 family RNA polymerase sigma factor [Candidatus Eisenbacteria bacterium]